MQATLVRRSLSGSRRLLSHPAPRATLRSQSQHNLNAAAARTQKHATFTTHSPILSFSSPTSSALTSTSSSYIRYLLGFLLTAGAGSAVYSSFTFIPRVQAAEGDAKPENIELDLPSSAAEGFENEQFKYNADGDVEWMSTSTRPRIVVLGTGWGSVSFLKKLDINKYEIVVISPRNYFLFTPLLPSACTGTLEMGSLTEPIRQILLQRHQTNQNQYIEAKAVGLDRDKRKVMCVDSNGRSFLIEYDHLIVGVGANNNTFNTPGVKDYAFFLKEAKHARIIRKNILDHFERASSPTTSMAEKEALLQFVIVGGGPTGVEFAGELVDFLDSDLSKQFPNLIPFVRVRLLQSQEHILNTYDAAISRYAEEKFKQLRIEVITNARVKGITEKSLTYEDKTCGSVKTVPFGLCLWSTGIEMNEFTRSVSASIAGQESEKALVTDEYLRLLQEIPHLDRVPKRVVQEAAKVVKPGGTVPPTVTPTPVTTPYATPTTTVTTPPADETPRDLNVDPRVYVLGDCATTYIPKLAKRMKTIFKAADTDGDGKLSYDELRNLCYMLSENFPVMSAQMSMIMNQYTRYAGDKAELNLDEFQAMLNDADKNVRVYPATAQVASQQGKYLAKRFNAFAQKQVKAGKMKDVGGEDHWNLEQRLVKKGVYQRESDKHPPIMPDPLDPSDAAMKPFRYKHLGSLAYIGGETAAIDLGAGGAYTGTAAFWLWKSAYLNEAVSTRTRLNLAFDWMKTFFFGRDTSKP